MAVTGADAAVVQGDGAEAAQGGPGYWPQGIVLWPRTPFHATDEMRSIPAAGAAKTTCRFGGIRKGGGSGPVQLTLPDGTVRVLQVENGIPVAVDLRPGESTASFGVARDGDISAVTISDQSFVIPDAAIFGGCPC